MQLSWLPSLGQENLESQSPQHGGVFLGVPYLALGRSKSCCHFGGRLLGDGLLRGWVGPEVPPTHSLERYLGEEERSVLEEGLPILALFFAGEKIKIQRKKATYLRSHSSQLQLVGPWRRI